PHGSAARAKPRGSVLRLLLVGRRLGVGRGGLVLAGLDLALEDVHRLGDALGHLGQLRRGEDHEHDQDEEQSGPTTEVWHGSLLSRGVTAVLRVYVTGSGLPVYRETAAEAHSATAARASAGATTRTVADIPAARRLRRWKWGTRMVVRTHSGSSVGSAVAGEKSARSGSAALATSSVTSMSSREPSKSDSPSVMSRVR